MLLWALESLRGMSISQLIIVVRETDKSYLDRHFPLLAKHASVVYSIGPPTGQLPSALEAIDLCQFSEGLLILGCDTYVESAFETDFRSLRAYCDGILSVASMPGDRWGFVKADKFGVVSEVAEKVRISDQACTGMYYFSSCEIFLAAANAVLTTEDRVKGEFYVTQAYNWLLRHGGRVIASNAKMWDMGTPEAISDFERNPPACNPDTILPHLFGK